MRFEALFDFLNGDTGAYAPLLPDWLNHALGYVDCFWFAALLGWVLVLYLWWSNTRHHAPPTWRWLPWTAVANLVCTGIIFLDLTKARLGSSIREAYLVSDNTLMAVITLMCAGWWWEIGRQSRRSLRWGTWVMAAAAPAIVPWVLAHPANWTRSVTIPASNYVAGVALLAAIPWWFRPRAPGWPRITLTLAALVPLFSPLGPWAGYVFFMRHKFGPLTPFCLLWGVLAAIVAGLTLAGQLRLERDQLGAEKFRRLWVDARPYLIGAAFWLALGGLTAWLIGERQRQSAEERALDQVRLAAAQLDPAIFARMTQPAFRLDVIQSGGRPYFPPTRLAFSHFLAGGGEGEAKRALRRIALANRTMMHLRFLTQRDGWLVGAAGYSAPMMSSLADAFGGTAIDGKALLRSWSFGFVVLARRPTPEDVSRWAAKTEWLEGPIATAVFTNPVVFARAPIVADDGRMLGWLEFTYLADGLLAETFQARIAPFIGTTLGVAMMGLLFARRRAAQAREAALRAAAVSTEAARVKTEFLAKVSHELRTPLQSVLGQAELLALESNDTRARTRIAALRESGTLMLRLVNDLLDLSAAEAGGFRFVARPTAVASITRDAIDSLRPRVESKGLALHLIIAPDFPAWLECDDERFRQILTNLVGNALKFTERGRIDVELSVRGHAPDGRCIVALSVRDTGPGIAPAEQAQLFQPFSRLDLTSRKEGTGLGLALTAALCRAADGTLAVESDGYSGSCFRAELRLPLAAAPDRPALQTGAHSALRGRRILVVDDNALVRDLFSSWLTELGARCESAPDGAAALATTRERTFDAVILDLAMPTVDGLAVARQWRAEGRKWRIIGVSAHGSAHDRAEALAAGMDAFLSKPVELAALAHALADETLPLLPPPRQEQLRAHLAERFRAAAPADSARAKTALQQLDWTALRASAHHLKSSAAVVRDETLYQACGKLEDAAEARDAAAAGQAWESCALALARWLRPG